MSMLHAIKNQGFALGHAYGKQMAGKTESQNHGGRIKRDTSKEKSGSQMGRKLGLNNIGSSWRDCLDEHSTRGRTFIILTELNRITALRIYSLLGMENTPGLQTRIALTREVTSYA